MVAFAHLAIYTVPKAATLGAMWNITDDASPAQIASAHIRCNGIAIDTGRVTDRVRTVGALPSIETQADIGGGAYTILA